MVGTRLEPPVGENDRVRDPADVPVTLVEHGDYDSPYTARAFFAGRGLLRKIGEERRFSFRAFPLVQFHHRLFEARRALTPEGTRGYAAEIGLGTGRFERELADHARAVREQLRSGLATGARGTPTFFISGRVHAGSYRMEDLEAAVRGALDET